MPLTLLPPAAAAYLLFLAFVCGACVGSFTNCYALRLVKGESVARGRSRCPACGHELGVRDLVPLFSWLFLRGKCRFCGARISARYPLTELALALACTAAAASFGLSLQTVEHCLLFAVLLAMALIDLDTMLIPDRLQLAAAGIFAVFLPAHAQPLHRLLTGVLGAAVLGGGVLVISLVMDKALGRESMGGGDIKLLAVLGLYAGPVVGLLLVIAACVLGLVFAAVRGARKSAFPFGPAIAAAAVPSLLLGPRLVEWYWNLFF